MRTLIVDNFDSFTNNIAQYIYEACGEQPEIVPNSTAFEDLDLEGYDAVILSPGPGHPARNADFGVCREVLARARIPVLGVCLGHQGINCFFGGAVEHAPEPVHGYRTRIIHSGSGLFAGIPQAFEVVRYHSLVCTQVPSCLEVTARSDCGLIMGLAHRERAIWGVQFHPESIDSEYGLQVIRNFVRLVAEARGRQNCEQEIDPVRRALQVAGGSMELSFDFQLIEQAPGPSQMFKAHFAERPAAFWLDSELSDRPQARYSVMGACDRDSALVFRYDVNRRRLSIEGPTGQANLEGDFFELMAGIVEHLGAARQFEAPFPFSAGLIGYLGYELKALTATGVCNTHVSELPDALFYLPQNMLVFDHRNELTYLCHLWGERLVLRPTGDAEQPRYQPFVPGPVAESALQLADCSKAYIEKVNLCLQQIVDGESYEICLTNRASLECTEDPLNGYLRMRSISPVPYGAYIDTGEFSILSASPETFLSIDGCGRIASRPIKGTRPRGLDLEQDDQLKRELASSAKDRAENLMIVDLVRHDLNSICVPGSVKVPKAFDIESYSSVHQLVSTVEGQLRAGVDSFAAIKACFPGGSMTGAPKVRTMEIIDKLESSARGIYSGALGWIGLDGYIDLSIVIRTTVIKDGMARFGIGGAIVAASDPAEEMHETLVKASVPFHSISAREIAVE
ncbi:aminodeoxychorismate synthase component I [Pseudomonas gingeri]|uniref:aminodeoxychorismate synthase n=1 Tax=Pseudomonas gingeri TaxID=117681 RepID=A0A7Y7Y8T5_9PSED|nr:aminodeoxychorismate synthase component I [Pseudomonas gingeri]NWB29779.1 aminodeoxychorismate synthase component I [Pseudomonas gingeri]NWC31915.1 aminodeoxychorismate synthase component I [Pseudomonas gingeri]